LAEENSADLVVCGFFIDTHCKGGVLSEKICVDDRVYENADEFRRESYRYFDRNMLYTPWNKLYRLDEIKEKNLRFPQTLWDDFPFNLSYIRTVERVVVSTEAYYHFIREREDSETSAYRPQMYEKREEEHGWMQGLYEEWGIDSGPVREMVSRRYVERLIGCIENVTSSRCTLTREQKKAQIRKMLKNPRVAVALSEARPKSFYMKLMLIPIRLKSVPLTMLESRVISRVKEKNGGLFARLKAGR
ncbi:MAG: glycosyltransferase family 2 protein, partial [Clostridiales bacterium]|nr:glycosyltransferase family 2 protein [Clostridiales bacterium]